LKSTKRKEALPDVVSRYLAGESIATIAERHGTGRRRIYKWMLTELGEEKYRELVTEMLVSRVADADDDLEAARTSGDPVRVAAAREVCRFARMDFERRRPSLYGAKQTNVNVTAVVADAGLVGRAAELLERLSPRTIEAETVEALPSP
jgi:hypothetical protein